MNAQKLTRKPNVRLHPDAPDDIIKYRNFGPTAAPERAEYLYFCERRADGK